MIMLNILELPRVRNIGGLLLLASLITGCVSKGQIKSEVNLNSLNGYWQGHTTTVYQPSGMTCSFRLALNFNVLDGVLTSVPNSQYQFSAPIRSDGFVKVIIPNVATFKGEGGLDKGYKDDIVFSGYLNPTEGIKGGFQSGACGGEWYAQLNSSDVRSASKSSYSSAKEWRKVNEFNVENPPKKPKVNRGPSIDTDFRPVAVKWEGYEEMFAGKVAIQKDNRKKGKFNLSLPKGDGVGAGGYRFGSGAQGIG